MTTAVPFDLDRLTLLGGGHGHRDEGVCFLEAVAWAAGEQHTDRPRCASPVLGAYGRALNDALDEAGRQRLKPYVLRFLNTAGNEEADRKCAWLMADWVIHVYAATLLRAAGMEEQAAAVAALPRAETFNLANLTDNAWRPTLDRVSRQAWDRRTETWTKFEADFMEAFKKAAATEGLDPESAALAALAALADLAALAALADLADLAARAALAALADLAARAARADLAALADLKDPDRRHDVYSAVYRAVYAELEKSVLPKLEEEFKPTIVSLQEASFDLLDRMLKEYGR